MWTTCAGGLRRKRSVIGWRGRSGAGNQRRALRPRVAPSLHSRQLTFTPGPLIWLTTVGDRSVLGIGDRLLDMPAEAHDFLSGLLDAECPVEPERLKGLDDESRAVVLRRLLGEGVLAHVD